MLDLGIGLQIMSSRRLVVEVNGAVVIASATETVLQALCRARRNARYRQTSIDDLISLRRGPKRRRTAAPQTIRILLMIGCNHQISAKTQLAQT